MKPITIAEKNNRRVATLLTLAEVVAVVYPVIILGKYFEFPAVLRQPAAYGLTLFRQHQDQIVPAYYVFMVSGLLFIPLSYACAALLKPGVSPGLQQALIGTGLATAIFQAIGFSRWVFVIQFLAEQYARQPAQRPAIELLYETLNRFAGMTIGEHLGFLAMGTWTILLAVLLLRSGVVNRWFALLGVPIGVGLFISVLEHFGGPSAELYATINFMANTAWSIWLLLVGGRLLIGRPAIQTVDSGLTALNRVSL
ncbi:DUF4386 domain-containing protein [Spirosoma spitsbergense]|uniref:DUF4386 domain-containing protein n=1 Tax=Spirosoma spitsbergense TaxID=431554 RepID=UPI0003773E2F|nr:DUF4386 domain-containing protein [Spirosoma spitsbergense]